MRRVVPHRTKRPHNTKLVQAKSSCYCFDGGLNCFCFRSFLLISSLFFFCSLLASSISVILMLFIRFCRASASKFTNGSSSPSHDSFSALSGSSSTSPNFNTFTLEVPVFFCVTMLSVPIWPFSFGFDADLANNRLRRRSGECNFDNHDVSDTINFNFRFLRSPLHVHASDFVCTYMGPSSPASVVEMHKSLSKYSISSTLFFCFVASNETQTGPT
mmetsp:Transcript_22242/g.33391  ORF Transcript_22242/g.33391 Transcript_22242/m.33391 type:complete len:216 (-) Transcript_22242:964-1611(-)